jgi:catechol 2,3-dioxygenase-like lactoylglutathione lyase family enzyme
MADEQLVRMVPVLAVRELAPAVAFYEWLGFPVLAEYPGYTILAQGAELSDSVEVHLSQLDDHDPSTAGVVYLRVRDARDLHERLRHDLESAGRLFLVPVTGFTEALTEELRAREDAGEDIVPLGEIEEKPWGVHEFGIIDPAGWLVRVGSPLG